MRSCELHMVQRHGAPWNASLCRSVRSIALEHLQHVFRAVYKKPHMHVLLTREVKVIGHTLNAQVL
jgi:hypothetical protein